MKAATKPQLAEALWSSLGDVKKNFVFPEGDADYFIDRESRHHIPWPLGFTYKAICDKYMEYLTQEYGSATVGFDAYISGPSTEDATHHRRTVGNPSTEVKLEKGMKCKIKYFKAMLILLSFLLL